MLKYFTRSQLAIIGVFSTSLIIFILSAAGVFDSLSAKVAESMYYTFGYTNKWSKSYGPEWFLNLNRNIGAFGSREMVLLFTAFLSMYIYKLRGKEKSINFFMTVASGALFILVVKALTTTKDELNFTTILTETLSNFPSGHTFLATVLYLSAAKYLSSRRKSESVNHYLFYAALIVIILVGVTRVTGSGHTVTEVIAGWSLGVCWYIFSQFILEFKLKKETEIQIST